VSDGPKDWWDKAEIVGKLLLVPVLVGLVGYWTNRVQQTWVTGDTELELALRVVSEPEFLSDDPILSGARDWAEEILVDHFGEEAAAAATAAARTTSATALIQPQTIWALLASGELTPQDVLADPRFANCPGVPREALVECVGSVLKFIESPGNILTIEGGVDLGDINVTRIVEDF